MSDMNKMWSLLFNSPLERTGLVKGMRLQYKAFKMLQPMGEALPLALDIGEKPIEPAIYMEPGEAVEQHAGKLLTAVA